MDPIVSIPFQRESISKEDVLERAYRTIQNVSIPFQRESISKDAKRSEMDPFSDEFRFPSNGKAYTKGWNYYGLWHVRIEFPFPSNGKAYPKTKLWNRTIGIPHIGFPFPSNGKAYPKREYGAYRGGAGQVVVSIPFQRESISKDLQRAMIMQGRLSFDSLPTGKHIQRLTTRRFPPRACNVSIPFQRESISKVGNILVRAINGVVFPFPSNGKAYPKNCFAPGVMGGNNLFPFPSNGKAYPKIWSGDLTK